LNYTMENSMGGWSNIKVYELLNVIHLDCLQGMFKLTMMLNAITCMVLPFHINLLTRMWCLMIISWMLVFSFFL
jgi:hypothetical protein